VTEYCVRPKLSDYFVAYLHPQHIGSPSKSLFSPSSLSGSTGQFPCLKAAIMIMMKSNVAGLCICCRLSEIGPRMTLQLIKIEEGVCSGEILYHEYVRKTAEELIAIKEMRQRKR